MSQRKSRSVPAHLLIAVAAGLLTTGCREGLTETRRCVDQQGNVLPEYECDRYYRSGGSSYYAGRAWSPGYFLPGNRRYYGQPRFVYGGGGSMAPGGVATGFFSQPSKGAHVVTPSGSVIRRGGFGTVPKGSLSRSSGGGSRGFSFGG